MYSYLDKYILHSHLISCWHFWLICRFDVCYMRNIIVVPVLTSQPTPKSYLTVIETPNPLHKPQSKWKKSFQRNIITSECFCCSIKPSKTVTSYLASFRYIRRHNLELHIDNRMHLIINMQFKILSSYICIWMMLNKRLLSLKA